MSGPRRLRARLGMPTHGVSGSALAGGAILAAIVALWMWRAMHDPDPWDTGLAYTAGQVAWATGHPEHVITWISTPFLGVVFAVLSQLFGVRTVADLVTVANAVVWVGASAVVLRRLRSALSTVWWWVLAFGLIIFPPMVSSVGFKQFNAIVLVLAAAGYAWLRQGRSARGAAAIGLSIAIKPMVVLLPVVLLARRSTRRAGMVAIAWAVGLNLAGQAFMAARAHSLATLDPLIPVRNFLDRTQPNVFTCLPSNFSPVAFVCRMGAAGALRDEAFQRAAALGLVALIVMWAIDALRDRGPCSWEVFAFVCPVSVMLGTVEWTHYQIMLAPLLVLLLVRFVQSGARVSEWAGLAGAFALTCVIASPYHGSPYASIFTVVRGTFGSVGTPPEPVFVEALAQFAQYLVLLTGILWFFRRRRSIQHGPLAAEPKAG
jgi:hypothetical protein